ncbi:PLAC8 family-domain-containing protein [Globomyces pollinis-pini]|nr:PLAC8 family-domain-containing protein [Globomyces pollinis-pini]
MSTAYTPSKSFHSGLFGCTNDLGTFCVSLLLPCLVYGQNKKMLNVESDCRTSGIKYGVCFVIQSCMGGKLRGEIRRERGLEGSALEDCMLHLACRPCALTQERIELDRMERFGHLDELVFQRKKVVD